MVRMSPTHSFLDIVDLMLKVNAGAYSIEAANVRHEHEWHLWKRRETAGRQNPDPRHRHAPQRRWSIQS